MDLLTHADAQMMPALPMLHYEPFGPYKRFLSWVRLGRPDFKLFAKAVPESWELLEAWSVEYNWHGRADASPLREASDIVKARFEEHFGEAFANSKLSEVVLELARRSVTKLLQQDLMTEELVYDPARLAPLLRAVHEYERLEAGQSTQNVAMAVDERALRRMDPEALKALRASLPSLFKDE